MNLVLSFGVGTTLKENTTLGLYERFTNAVNTRSDWEPFESLNGTSERSVTRLGLTFSDGFAVSSSSKNKVLAQFEMNLCVTFVSQHGSNQQRSLQFLCWTHFKVELN